MVLIIMPVKICVLTACIVYQLGCNTREDSQILALQNCGMR